MSRKAPAFLSAALLLVSALAGCAPKYATYASVNGDFRCLAPWRWKVITAHEGTHYTDTTFIGPFDPKFYLGAPSLSIRWYRDYASHRLGDGSLEMYSGPDDYIRQTLRNVYGPESQLAQPMNEVLVAGLPAKHFVVLSEAPAPAGARWGVLTDQTTGKRFVPQKHAYVVVPVPDGFYVLIYPATDPGYADHLAQFNTMVNTFFLAKDGPAGQALASGSGFSGAPAGSAP
ncbi:MAG: hypothetical protein KGL04_04850 [Elusimicrobia bacterium]|nr:hypothetical protein [Elusimicrobiota bacterium]MDE2313486.1 hypothetical protein [Elusimicrobiota bacterium]